MDIESWHDTIKGCPMDNVHWETIKTRVPWELPIKRIIWAMSIVHWVLHWLKQNASGHIRCDPAREWFIFQTKHLRWKYLWLISNQERSTKARHPRRSREKSIPQEAHPKLDLCLGFPSSSRTRFFLRWAHTDWKRSFKGHHPSRSREKSIPKAAHPKLDLPAPEQDLSSDRLTSIGLLIPVRFLQSPPPKQKQRQVHHPSIDCDISFCSFSSEQSSSDLSSGLTATKSGEAESVHLMQMEWDHPLTALATNRAQFCHGGSWKIWNLKKCFRFGLVWTTS